jgi:hypothetical protein
VHARPGLFFRANSDVRYIILKLKTADPTGSIVLSEMTTRNKICNLPYRMENPKEPDQLESAATISTPPSGSSLEKSLRTITSLLLEVHVSVVESYLRLVAAEKLLCYTADYYCME